MSKIAIIRDSKNKPAYAVVPWKDYIALAGQDAEDAYLLEMADAARGDERFPAEVVERLIVNGENQIKVFREWRNLTQAELAKKSGLANHYISQLETGHRKIGGQAAKKLAPALDIGLDVLME